MSEKRTQLHIYFNELEIELGKKKAASLGMGFSKWVKYLVSKEIEPLSEFANIKVEKPRQITAQEMIDADRKQIDEWVREAQNSSEEYIDPETDLPFEV